MIYLLDTNACVTFLRGRNRLLRHRVLARAPSDISVCSVVVGELYHGAGRSADPVKERLKVDSFLQPYRSLSYDDFAAQEYARIRCDLETRGVRIGDSDMQIAAIAIVHNLIVVTHNTAEFSRIPNLVVEDWELP